MVKLRLTRIGRKKQPYYRIIAIDSRKRRDGAFLDRIGYYHPLEDPAGLKIDADKALKWLRVGAQPSNTVRSLLRRQGVWYRFLLEKRKLPEAQIETLMGEWMATHASSGMVAETPATDAKVVEPEAVKAPEKVAEPAAEVKAPEKVVEPAPEVKADEKVAEPTPEVKAEEKVADPAPEPKADEAKSVATAPVAETTTDKKDDAPKE